MDEETHWNKREQTTTCSLRRTPDMSDIKKKIKNGILKLINKNFCSTPSEGYELEEAKICIKNNEDNKTCLNETLTFSSSIH